MTKLPERRECITCPANQFPGDASQGTDNSTCYCDDGYYNASAQGLFVCFDDADAFDITELERQEQAAENTLKVIVDATTGEKQHCQRCPTDRHGSSCAVCDGSNGEPPRVVPGYIIPPNLSASDHTFLDRTETFIFDCGAEHIHPEIQCPGYSVRETGCAVGYAGVLCQHCKENHFKVDGNCTSCADRETMKGLDRSGGAAAYSVGDCAVPRPA